MSTHDKPVEAFGSHRTDRCRSCGCGGIQPVLSLGKTPLANSLLTKEQLNLPEPVFPLELAYCPECSLAQILETVPPATMFASYPYFSSFSDTAVRNAESIARRIINGRQLDASKLVVEIASNDGYLLQFYQCAGVPVLGIEPASNIAEVARRDRGIPTLSEFFGADLARRVRQEGRSADVIHANNVLAHVPGLNDVVEGIRILLKDDGVAVIEVPYVKEMIERCEFDTIYHEHLCYFSVTALDRLFKRHGLILEDIERLPIHGGSLRLFVAHGESAEPNAAVEATLQEERARGIDRLAFYQDFAGRVEKLKRDLQERLGELKDGGKRLAAYGAAAKGSTLLNYCGIGREILEFVVDRNTHKQGLYMPGVHLPIFPPDKLLESQPDGVLLLTWNFADEIMEQQAEYRHRGGRFVIPIPEVRVA
ncbi:MAG: class I SAM-dependent methyltransferase [Acidobacteriota bacterium]|nr:class I SAM-dependent methyltransferase [Acidobacteriota bacterium]